MDSNPFGRARGGMCLIQGRLRHAPRKKLADERKVPAFVVFSDQALQDMAARKPRTRDEFLDVHGVGQKKLEEYGDSFLAEILRER